ncbi:hypothetical protein ACO0R3_002749 [Hanseniaspora guilliermondii]
MDYNKLSFTNFEYNFINLIKLYLNHHNTLNPNDIIICRIAGGWVRDKILNIPSNDIDIAIENKNVSGQLFLHQLIEFYKFNNYSNIFKFNELNNTNFIFKNIFNTGIHATRINPEKSKHLETAMASIFNHSIDFVSLRKEVYTNDNNRIPQIDVGTPLEDCLRRDCTINSLFYNINTGCLEDLSNLGLMDLQNGIIRTPLDPMKTFTDDPLRIFRLLRFKNKLNFKYHEDLIQCFKKNHDTLCGFIYKKVSRERVAIEVNKILSTNNIQICKDFLKDLEVFNFEKFLYANNQNSYEDELNKLKQEGGKLNQKKNLLVDKVILSRRTLEYFENDLKSKVQFFVKTMETSNIRDLDMTIVCHAVLLSPLLNPRLQYSIKQNDMIFIKRDMELVLLSNGITKGKVKQIIALQELLCHEEYLKEFNNRASLCMFIKENMTDLKVYSIFMDILRIFFPDKYKAFINELLKNNVIGEENEDLDMKWDKENFNLKWNGKMIMGHLNKKPGAWMKEVITQEWVYLFENNIDVQDKDVDINDFIEWMNQKIHDN